MIIRILMFLAGVVAIATPVLGQTTQPVSPVAARPAAEDAWAVAVQKLAKSLVAGELDDTQALLTPRASVRRFDGSQTEETWRMAERAVKSTVIGQHAYSYPPLVMAADISADFKNAAAVPEKVKALYAIDDETEIKRANTTAAQWLAEELSATDRSPVGVIVLWTPRPLPPGVKTSAAPAFDVMFVLCRGQKVGQQYKINAIVYGSPVAMAGE
jgi:hypothetical protein